MVSMQLTSNKDTAATLALQSEQCLRREEDFQDFNNVTSLVDLDEEADSPCPIFDHFYNQGRWSAIKDLTNFTAPDLNVYGSYWHI